MELTIKDGKFYILENNADENNVERYVYDDERAAVNRLKEAMKTIDTNKLLLSVVDVTGKTWNISSVPWSTIATAIIREK